MKQSKGSKSTMDSLKLSESMNGNTESGWQLPDSAVAAGRRQPAAIFSVRQRHLPFRGDGAASAASGCWIKSTHSLSVETPVNGNCTLLNF